jgi:hypothetical protein
MIKLENLTEDEVEDILTQGDARYYIDQIPLMAAFIKVGAIDVSREVINDIEIKDRNELQSVTPPQQLEKLTTKKLFEKLGVKFVCFEYSASGGRADVKGEKGNATILVECGPCRADKLIRYLSEDNTELWIVTCYFKQDQLLHIFKRGPNWKVVYEAYKKKEFAELRKIKSPFDNL